MLGLSSFGLSIPSFVSPIKWLTLLSPWLVVIVQGEGGTVLPFDDIIDRLLRSYHFNCFLFQVSVDWRDSGFDHIFEDVSGQSFEEHLPCFWVACRVVHLSCQFFKP